MTRPDGTHVDIVIYYNDDLDAYDFMEYIIDDQGRSYYEEYGQPKSREQYVAACEQADLEPLPDVRDVPIDAFDVVYVDEWEPVHGLTSGIEAPVGTQLLIKINTRDGMRYLLGREEITLKRFLELIESDVDRGDNASMSGFC